jgi:two-component system chemotaxis response regulator CheY
MNKRVIIVDDSKTTRLMVAFTLRRAGYDVIEANDGAHALSLIGASAVDCVITDLSMPQMDGLDLIRQLRASALHKSTPILMLTTTTEADKQREGLLAGASDWIGKPFHPDTLLETVGRIA